MSKVILMVNVELAQDKRDDYLATTTLLKSRFESNPGVHYEVFETQGKDSLSYTEMFTFGDMSAYEAFDDDDDEQTKDLFAKITDLASRSPRYTTLVEVA